MTNAITSLQLKPGIYRHYKDTEYRVFGTALHTDLRYMFCAIWQGTSRMGASVCRFYGSGGGGWECGSAI